MSKAEEALELCIRLRAGVPQREERWPGNDGSDVIPDVAVANYTMKAAADMIKSLLKEIKP